MHLVAGCITLIIVPCPVPQGSSPYPLLLHKALCHPRLKLSQEVFANIEVCENPFLTEGSSVNNCSLIVTLTFIARKALLLHPQSLSILCR
jgi:hypothetical protein